MELASFAEVRERASAMSDDELEFRIRENDAAARRTASVNAVLIAEAERRKTYRSDGPTERRSIDRPLARLEEVSGDVDHEVGRAGPAREHAHLPRRVEPDDRGVRHVLSVGRPVDRRRRDADRVPGRHSE